MHRRKKIIQLKKAAGLERRSVVAEWREVCAYHLILWLCPFPTRGSLSWGMFPRDPWMISCQNPGHPAQEMVFLHSFSSLCLLPFPSPPLSHCGLSSELSPSDCRTCGRADSHLTPLPSTSSARKAIWACDCLCHLSHRPGSMASSDVRSTRFQVQRWMVLSGVLCRSALV